ncbi:MAG: hypothetical protein HYZ63_03615 [Candidatus Andersenbacteria bacterium]|nr:hypothetical protein [Candidatus Andersenbacteria bacterium]
MDAEHLVIGFDLDETLVVSLHIFDEFFKFLDEKRVAHDKVAFARTHHWSDGVPEADINALFEEFHERGNVPAPLPMPGAQQAIAKIHAEADIHVITARTAKVLTPIRPHLHREVFAGRSVSLWPCHGMSKRDIIVKKGIQWYVDESISELGRLVDVPGLKLVQMPSFFGITCPRINHRRVFRLPACDSVGDLPINMVRALAWDQVTELINCNPPDSWFT